jgi:hypothetical protein
MRSKLYGFAVSIFSALAFGYLCIRSFFPSIKSNTNLLEGFTGLVPAVLLFFLLWAVDRLIVGKMDRPTCKAVVVFMVAINTAMQIVCLIDLKVKPSWDFGVVMAGADDIAAGQPIRNVTYFQEYPFNLNPAVVLGTFKYLMGGFVWAPYILNIFAVTSSIVGACMTAWRVFSPHTSVRAALFCLAATPLYLYIPIVYTDTLSMPFAIWSVYAWSFLRFPGAFPARARGLPACAAVGLLAAAGFLIKPVAAICLPAFAVDYFMCPGGYEGIRTYNGGGIRGFFSGMIPVVSAAAVFLIVIFSFKAYIGFKGYTDRLDLNKGIPYTHWLLMGMNRPVADGGTSNSYGGFNYEDLKFTRSYKTLKEREGADIARIVQRLEEFGAGGYASFLLKKIEWTWTDGTYFTPVKLGRYPEKLNMLHKFVLSSEGKSHRLYLAFTQITQGMLLFLLFAGSVFSVRRSDGGVYRLLLLMCLGLMFFLAFWETRSRYLTFLIPVFILLASATAGRIFDAMDELLKKLKYKYRNYV